MLLQSRSFESPRDAALAIATLQKEGASALAGLREKVEIASGATEEDIGKALEFLAPGDKI